MVVLALAGVLVTSQGGHEIGREQWHDDGVVLASDVTAGPTKLAVSIDRKQRTVRMQEGTTTVTKSLAPDATPLVNGAWATYALIGERIKDGQPPAPIKIFLAERDLTLDGTAQATKTAGGRHLTVHVAGLEVQVDLDAKGAVVHAAVPAQAVVVDAGAAVAAPPAPAAVTAAPPPTVTEEAVACDSGGAHLRGVVWRPRAAKGPLPLVIIVAGSGPTDRDGNNTMGLRTDMYRLLAAALAEHGVASLRYDKRGIGQSTTPTHLVTLDDFVGDAAALVTEARASQRYSAVYLLGHSEGALIALSVGKRLPLDGILSVSGAGRPLAAVVREQLARQLPANELAEFDHAVAELRTGRALAPLRSSTLRLLFRPNLEPFLRQALFADPLALAQAQKTPLTIIQGDTDAQVTVDADARALAKARPDARLFVLHDVAHTLKVEHEKSVGQRSYGDPTLPLAPGVVDAVLSGLKQ